MVAGNSQGDGQDQSRGAKRLKLRCIAEGVENRAQLEFLRANHCEAFQGFLFSRPVTALEATAMLKAQASSELATQTAVG